MVGEFFIWVGTGAFVGWCLGCVHDAWKHRPILVWDQRRKRWVRHL